MKHLIYLSFVFIIFACSDSNSSNSSNSSESSGAEDIAESFEMESDTGHEMINCETADSVLQSFIRIRNMLVDPVEEYDITGEVVYDQDGLWIINIEESYNYHPYFVSLVFGASNDLYGSWEVSDGVEADLADFAADRIKANFGFFQGNFLPSKISYPNQTVMVLNQVNWFRTYYSGQEFLYFINGNNLERTAMVARTDCILGECEEMTGFSEEFVQAGPGEIHVLREENHSNECIIEKRITYRKIWREKEHMLTEAFPRYFKMDYIQQDTFLNLPREFYLLTVRDQDTLTDVESYKINFYYMNEMAICAGLVEATIWDAEVELIVGFEVHDDKFRLYTRNSGIIWAGGDNYGVDEVLVESEMNMALEEMVIEPMPEDPELFRITYRNKEGLFCVKENRYAPFDYGGSQ